MNVAVPLRLLPYLWRYRPWEFRRTRIDCVAWPVNRRPSAERLRAAHSEPAPWDDEAPAEPAVP